LADGGDRGFGRFGVADGDAEEGAAGLRGGFAFLDGFDEHGLGDQGVDGAGAGLGGHVGGNPGGDGIALIEQGLDTGLLDPDDELLEGEAVGLCDPHQLGFGLKEVHQEAFGIDGDVVDLVVDGSLERWMK
jgi:hypothetical protein